MKIFFPDKKVASIFSEPSTRTKLSFEIAACNLGAKFIDFNIENSSIQKGETLEDTIEAMMLMGSRFMYLATLLNLYSRPSQRIL